MVTAAAAQTLADIQRPLMLIDGKRVASAGGRTLTVENPANRKPIAEIARGNAEDVDRAVKAAAAAFPAWSKVAPRDRGKLLLKIADALEARTEELARIIAQETGNALRTQARGEAALSGDIFRYFGGLASELKGETIPLGEHVLSYTRREPIGVVGAIVPWNAPVLLSALKIAPAVCAGNTHRAQGGGGRPARRAVPRRDRATVPAARRRQRHHRPRPRDRRAAGQASAGAQAVLHRLDRGRQDRHGRGGGADRARLARTRRQEPVDRLSRRRRGLGGRRRHRVDALHAPEPILHGRLAPVPAREHLRLLPRRSWSTRPPP